MRLTRRGKIAATLAAIAMGAGIAAAYDAPAGEAPGVKQAMMVCGEALDGQSGTACYLPGDVPTSGAGLAGVGAGESIPFGYVDLTFLCTNDGTAAWVCVPTPVN